MTESPVFAIFKDYNPQSNFACVAAWTKYVGIKENYADTKHAKMLGIDAAKLIASVPMTLLKPTGQTETEEYTDKSGHLKTRKITHKVIDPMVTIIKPFKGKTTEKKTSAKPKKETKSRSTKTKPKVAPEIYTEGGKKWSKEEKTPCIIHKTNGDFRYLYEFMLAYAFNKEQNDEIFRGIVTKIAGNVDINLISFVDKDNNEDGLDDVTMNIKTENLKLMQDTSLLLTFMKAGDTNALAQMFIAFYYQIVKRLANGRIFSEKAPHYTIENFFTVLKILVDSKEEKREINKVYAEFKVFFRTIIEPGKPKKATKTSATSAETVTIQPTEIVEESSNTTLIFDEGEEGEEEEEEEEETVNHK